MKVFLNCKECTDLLMDYLEGNLEVLVREKLDKHFATCPPCISFLKSYTYCSELAQQLRDQEVEIPLELESRLRTFLKEEIKKA